MTTETTIDYDAMVASAEEDVNELQYEVRKLRDEAIELESRLRVVRSRLHDIEGDAFNTGNFLLAKAKAVLDAAKQLQCDANKPSVRWTEVGQWFNDKRDDWVVDKITDKTIWVRPRGKSGVRRERFRLDGTSYHSYEKWKLDLSSVEGLT